jgi:8-oxo-dGTP pyrophosphatase MutT (NUDIX family)
MGQELSRETLITGRVLNLQSIRWRNYNGFEGTWEMASRNGDMDAVMVIARLMPSDRLVLIRQYRPPAGGMVIEFPAGIMEAGEAPEQAALRELAEETGFQGTVARVLPCGFNTPGLSNERAYVVIVDIDEGIEANQRPVQRPDIGEEISVLLVPRNAMPEFLRREAAEGARFDSKVVCFGAAMGAAW